MRKNYSSGAKWEPIVGYSRAVRIENTIEVSGTVSVKDGELYGEDDPYLQTKRALEIIEEAVTSLGGSLTDVIRTRVYVTDINHWEEVGRAHGEVFKDIKPATSLFEVSQFISADFLVEIEATAIVS